jgi:hypothetical protein
VQAYCEANGLAARVLSAENGVVCDAKNPWLQRLIAAVRSVSAAEPRLGKKLAGTSARFAPGGQGVVWGQSGLAPHGRDERHYIPSILPYYRVLNALFDLPGMPQR